MVNQTWSEEHTEQLEIWSGWASLQNKVRAAVTLNQTQVWQLSTECFCRKLWAMEATEIILYFFFFFKSRFHHSSVLFNHKTTRFCFFFPQIIHFSLLHLNQFKTPDYWARQKSPTTPWHQDETGETQLWILIKKYSEKQLCEKCYLNRLGRTIYCAIIRKHQNQKKDTPNLTGTGMWLLVQHPNCSASGKKGISSLPPWKGERFLFINCLIWKEICKSK